MCPIRKKHNSLSEVLKFTYPKLHTGTKWYVDFYAYDPADGSMRRKKYHLDSIEKITERRRRANELVESLTKLLRTGWSPWVDVDSNRGYTLFTEALNKYEAYVNKKPKYKTRKAYLSRLKILREYNDNRVLPIRYCYQYDTAFVSDFLDYIFLDRECSALTRNNYRAWCQALASFMQEKQYIKSNPVEVIKNIAETSKKRQPLTATMLQQLAVHLKENNPYFYLAFIMEYYTFIRPEELSHIQLDDISVKEQSIFVPGTIAKNKRDAKVGLNDNIIRCMLDLAIFENPSSFYLFGPKVSRPSATRGDSEMFRRQWNKLVRKGLGWPDCYQFYSLKDSGLRDLANSEGIVIARDQARHSDVSTTNKYLQGRDASVHEETKHFKGNL